MADPKEPPSTSSNPSSRPSGLAFIPLENNPEIMTSLLHTLGLSKTLSFQDVYSLEDPTLLSFLPRPTHALLLIFPVSSSYESFRHAEDHSLQPYTACGTSEEVMWFKQTIKNACGLIGILHAACNGATRDFLEPGGPLATLIADATPLPPDQRAHLLATTPVLAAAHESAAKQGDTAAPSAHDPIDLHYVCFIKSGSNNLWELDGRRKGPLMRGELGIEEDVLSEKALEMGVKQFLKREQEAGGGDLRFSLLALGPSME